MRRHCGCAPTRLQTGVGRVVPAIRSLPIRDNPVAHDVAPCPHGRATTSRGARSPCGCTPSINNRPCSSRKHAPAPRRILATSGRQWRAGTLRAVEWNCTNSRSHGSACGQPESEPCTVRVRRIGAACEQCADSAGGEYGRSRLDVLMTPSRVAPAHASHRFPSRIGRSAKPGSPSGCTQRQQASHAGLLAACPCAVNCHA